MNRPAPHSQDGVALMVTIAAMMVVALGITAMTVVSRGMADRAQDARDRAAGGSPTDEGTTVYIKALSSGDVGEHTAFVLGRAKIDEYVREQGGSGRCGAANEGLCYLPNAETTFPQVDTSNIPSSADDRFDGQYTVRRRVKDGVYSFWQVLAIVPPRFGEVGANGRPVSPGGRLVVFVRGWTGSADESAAKVKPLITRAELRPQLFSDFQILADGKILLGAGAVITGAVHSNGFDQSFNDQYQGVLGANESIRLMQGAFCRPGARLGTKTGTVTADPNSGCEQYKREGNQRQINMLRAGQQAAFARTLCNRTTPTVQVICAPATGSRWSVNLSGTTANVPGLGSFDVSNGFLGRHQGAPALKTGTVLVFDRSVQVSGELAARSRLTIVASNPDPSTLSEPPSIYLASTRVGSRNDSTTSLGLVADSDIIAVERNTCPVRVQAALVAMGGMLSMDPQFRGAPIPGDTPCGGTFTLRGSIAGHYPPYMLNTNTGAGFANRSWQYDPNLYHNPPPLFPTHGPWETLKHRNADLDCFDPQGRLRDDDGESCS